MTAKLTEGLCGFYADVSTIHKDSKGNFGKYADLATVLSAVNPALAKNGLAVVQTFDTTEAGEQLLVTTLLHKSGESISSRLPLVISKGRNPLHDWGGATTYQRRYALLALLNLAAGIEDDDGEGAAPAAPAAANAAPAAKPKPKPAPTPAKAPASKADPADTPLNAEERKLVLALLMDLSPDQLNPILEQFREQFGIPADIKTSTAITTAEHASFIRGLMEQC